VQWLFDLNMLTSPYEMSRGQSVFCKLRFLNSGFVAKAKVRTAADGYTSAPMNLADEVDDVEALCDRMKSAGYGDSTPPNAHPHRKRRYFYDSEGNDWEFVEYLSQNPTERNDYKLPDR
jgi:uncharacterized glyoxalase superfamily protein PhnB